MSHPHADARLRWIYLTDHNTDEVTGMRTWLGDYRADIIQRKDGEFEYWCSETFNSGADVYWTKARFHADVFKAMAAAEKWLAELNEARNYDPIQNEER